MFGGIGPMEVVLVLAIALIVLGPKKLPEAARSVGKGLREFRESVSGIGDDEHEHDEPEPALDPEPSKPPR
jgi:sec-independent protein translocase protein TatA